MEMKKRSTTQGAPLILGLVAAVLLLVGVIISAPSSMDRVNEFMAEYSLQTDMDFSAMGSGFMIFGMIVGYVIYPGIFLIMLLTGINKPRRGMTFAVVWIVFAGLGVLGGLASIQQPITLVTLLGNIALLGSCITFLMKLNEEAKQHQNQLDEQMYSQNAPINQ